MHEERFEVWLSDERNLGPGTVESRVSGCRRVERIEGDLDGHFDKDGLTGLIELLNPKGPKHGIPINGDIRAGTSTLRSAIRLYREFRNSDGGDAGSTGSKPLRQSRDSLKPKQTAPWPNWPQPDSEAYLELARKVLPHVRFLNPEIVKAIAEDNRSMRDKWSSQLKELGIDPAIYLWECSPCAFPGVRRYAGSAEIAAFRQKAAPKKAPPECLALDDNDYPKHLWSIVFTGKPFRKRGPGGYQLAHLFDHKLHGNRWRDELVLPADAEGPAALYGLFTSAANSAYVPSAFLRPTDFSPALRSLIQRRAKELYGGVCRIVPPPLEVKHCDDPVWGLGNFRWSEPVGGLDRIEDFLEFRRERVGKLVEERLAARRADSSP